MGKLTNIIGTRKDANNCEMYEIRMDRRWGETMLAARTQFGRHTSVFVIGTHRVVVLRSIDVDWIRFDWIRIGLEPILFYDHEMSNSYYL